jgi:hypothetical protein
MRTVALVIASDPGTGLEGSKYVSSDRDPSMIERAASKAASWPVDEVVVVLGLDADEIIANAGLEDVTLVIDPEWAEGIAASLRVAIDLTLRGPATDRIVKQRLCRPPMIHSRYPEIASLHRATPVAVRHQRVGLRAAR